MLKLVFCLVGILAVVSAEEIDHSSCTTYPDSNEAPYKVELVTSDDGSKSLDVSFFANLVNEDSPVKIKQVRNRFNYRVKLLNVVYPISEKETSVTYKEYKINVPIPDIGEINDDVFEYSLAKPNDGSDQQNMPAGYGQQNIPSVWCFGVTVKAVNGIKEDPTTMPPPIAID